MPQLKPTRGIRLNRSHLLSRGLVGLWLFNEGSGNTVFDLSGYNNEGAFQGSTSWSIGTYGSAVNMPGTDDYINIGTKEAHDFGTASFSVLAWFKSNATSLQSQSIVSRDDLSAGTRRFWGVKILDSDHPTYPNELVFVCYPGYDIVCSGDSFMPGDATWHQVVGVRDGSNLKLYLDGVFLALSTDNNVNTSSSTARLHFGGSYDSGGPEADDYNGLLDHVILWDRALTTAEIALLYREPFCMFERAWIPKLIGGQIVELAGSSVALSASSATAKVTRKVDGSVVGTSDVAALLNLTYGLPVIEKNWLTEALFNGMTANAFKLGTTLSLGWFWVRVAGCSVLYRGSSMGEIDFVNILAVAEQDACEISPPSYISHNSGSTYFYVVRRFNNCGYQECTLAASVKVSIESNGELAEPQPNKVFDLGAELVDGNKIQLVWYYCPLEQKSQPMCFNVYYDGRTGQINYENPLAMIGYKGRKFYTCQCGALEAGRYLFAIRTEDVSGIENSSLARLRIQFVPTNPDAIDILSAEGV
jgi:hypothetical protein